jgi:hypothetical protein
VTRTIQPVTRSSDILLSFSRVYEKDREDVRTDGTECGYLLDAFLVVRDFVTWSTLLTEPEHPSGYVRLTVRECVSKLAPNITNIRISQRVDGVAIHRTTGTNACSLRSTS